MKPFSNVKFIKYSINLIGAPTTPHPTLIVVVVEVAVLAKFEAVVSSINYWYYYLNKVKVN